MTRGKLLLVLTITSLVASLGWHLVRPDRSQTRVQTRAGETVNLPLTRSNATMLHFWASWCGPCRDELPGFIEYAERQRAMGHAVHTVSLDRNWSEVDRYMSDSDLQFETYLDPKGDLAERWMVSGIPTTIVIGEDGRELGRFVGSRDWGSPRQMQRVASLLP